MSLKDSSLLEILSERLIKPSSCTPPSLRSYKLSRKDQMIHASYRPRAFFYPFDNIHESKDRHSSTEISELLQTSLSRTLTYYYPFAGRLKNNSFVDCNDAGVQFTDARIKCSMSEILKQENSYLRDLVFPRCFFTDIIPTECSLLIVQVSYFDCGGVAVALCVSHKVSDGSTTYNFINDWSAMARTPDTHVPAPLFNGASLFPPIESDVSFNNELKASNPPESCITRSFLFRSSKLDELKNIKANSSGICNPTRYEVVAALLFRCAVAAATANSGCFRPSILFNAVNLRSLTVPPLPKNSVGNILTSFVVSATTESHMKFPNLVHQIRNKKTELRNEYSKGIDRVKEIVPPAPGSKMDHEVASERIDQIYSCSSTCGLPFYDIDFGFGKPVLVCDTNQTGAKNRFFLRDTRDGDAIEAIVTLDPTEMSLFQGNKELLAFASLTS